MSSNTTLGAAAIRIPGVEKIGKGINPFGDFNKPQNVGVIFDTTGREIEFDYKGTTYYRPKSIEFSTTEAGSDELDDAFVTREDYQRSVSAELSIEAKYGAFSGSFEGTFGSDYQVLTERAAAIHRYNTKLWSLELITPAQPAGEFVTDVNALPATFDHQQSFYDFIRKYGVFVVTKVVVGGSLEYSMLVDRRQTTSKETLKAKVKAEYGVMFKGSASAATRDEVARFSEHRTSRLITRGGDDAALRTIDTRTPGDHSSAFNAWKNTIAATPGIVSIELKRIDQFAGTKSQALAAAIEKYIGGTLVVGSNWLSAEIVLAGAQANAFPGVDATFRTVLIDKKTLRMEEKKFRAPDPGNDPASSFTTFWNSVQAHIGAANPREKMLVVALERWPRDPRYFPSPAVRETLLKHGAHEATIDKWDALTRNAMFCPIAGVSYVLAGDDGRNKGADALATGFGDPDRTLRPRARVSVLLPRNPVTGLVRVLPDDKAIEDPGCDLYQVQSHAGSVLSADPGGSSAAMLKPKDDKQPEQYWYLMATPTRYNWQPYALVNYVTCGMLQGKAGGGQTAICRYDHTLQDDVLWDIRGDMEKANMLLLHYHEQSWNLTNMGATAGVRPWYQDGMWWRRIKRLPA